MATSYHNEARIKQARLDRWNAQKQQAELAPQVAGNEILEDISKKQKGDPCLVTDPGQFHSVRSVHTWTGTERNRRFYDFSREGPLLGSSWRELQRELTFREKNMSMTFPGEGRGGHGHVKRGVFLPADPAFMGK